MKRTASAVWQGGIKDGKGSITTQSSVLSSTQYSYSTRFENGAGTNPEELIAAAHAGCFAMALSAILGQSGITAQEIDAQAAVSLEKSGDGFAITESHLKVTVKAPGSDKAAIEQALAAAKAGCPVSKVLNAKITLDSTVEN